MNEPGGSKGSAEPSEELQRLRREVESLKAERDGLKAEREDLKRREAESRATRVKWAGKLGAWVVAGPGLTGAFERWMRKAHDDKAVPVEETGQVAAAVVRRILAIGVVGITIAVLPTLLLYQQNKLVGQQNTLVETQNTKVERANTIAVEALAAVKVQNQFFQQQIRQGAEQDYRARKAALIGVLFDRENCNKIEFLEEMSGVEKARIKGQLRKRRGQAWQSRELRPADIQCPHKASLRARYDAFTSLRAIEDDMCAQELGIITLPKPRSVRAPWGLSLFHHKFWIQWVDWDTAWDWSVVVRHCRRRWSFKGVSLSMVSGSEGSLNGTDLRWADLSGAKLTRVAFYNAHLKGVRFLGAHLERAVFRSANLEGGDFRDAHLKRADLRGAHLERANLGRTQLEGGDLRNAHLEGAYLGGTHMEGANLSGAHLEGARLNGAHLESAQLREARLEGAILHNTHLEGANLLGAYLEGAYLSRVHLEGADLKNARMEGALVPKGWLKSLNTLDPPIKNLELSNWVEADCRFSVGGRLCDLRRREPANP